MQDWQPHHYLRFAEERTRPARDLIHAVPALQPRQITDLGCGPGNSTYLLHQRWPDAHVTGIDSSSAMLEQARVVLPDCDFERADIRYWQPSTPQDVILANASLQWVGGYNVLLPDLVTKLAAGGTLAIQMPDNFEEPSHRLMRDTARALGLNDASRDPLPTAEYFYSLLCQTGCQVNIWRTTYYHPLASSAAIIDWLQATGLRPFLAELKASQRAEFLAYYSKLLNQAYPVQSDGQVLLRFPRLFIVARHS